MWRKLISPWRTLPRGFWLWLALAGLSACLIVGPHHADEWGQITAFYLNKLQIMQDSDMPWEFAERMRPWFQPLTYAALLGGFIEKFGYHHFTMERVLLLLHWVLLISMAPVYWRLLKSAGSARTPASAYWLLGTVWFLPSMMVRHSSEVFSALFLLLTLWSTRKAESDRGHSLRWGVIGGLCAGLAFWSRYQSALFVVGFWFTLFGSWMVARRYDNELGENADLRAIVGFAVGVLVTMPVGVVLDYIGYGEWVFSPFEYFRANVLENRASAFGESGPWFYFVVLLGAFLNPFIWVWLYEGARAIWSKPWLRATTIGLLTFLGAHTAIGHKEPRFLLPVLPMVGLLVIAYLSTPNVRWPWMRHPRLVKTLTALQIVALVGYTLLGLTKDRVRIDLALWDLPAGQVVISGANMYGGELLDVRIEPYTQQLGEGLDYTRRYVRPPQLTLVGAYSEDYRRACDQFDDALVLLTSVDANREEDRKSDRLLNYPWDPIASFPRPWFTVDAKWYRKMWRFKLIRCDELAKEWQNFELSG